VDNQTDGAAPALLDELMLGAFVPIAEAMPAMLWLGDPDGRCIYLNKALREFWGVAVGDLPRFSWSTTLLSEDGPQLYAVFTAAMADRTPFTVQARYRRADGAIRVLQTQAQPRFAPNGEFLGMVGVNVDVTEAPGVTSDL
jgi:PAS domain S-box-containing protein